MLPREVNEEGDAAVIRAMPETGPQEGETQDLVRSLRDDVLPAATVSTGENVTAHVGGTTASFIDDAERTTDRLAVFVGGVIFLSFLLLVSVFRSIPVALKAAIMNLLSIGAAAMAMEGTDAPDDENVGDEDLQREPAPVG